MADLQTIKSFFIKQKSKKNIIETSEDPSLFYYFAKLKIPKVSIVYFGKRQRKKQIFWQIQNEKIRD